VDFSQRLQPPANQSVTNAVHLRRPVRRVGVSYGPARSCWPARSARGLPLPIQQRLLAGMVAIFCGWAG